MFRESEAARPRCSMDQPVWSLLKMVRHCRIKGIFLLIFMIPGFAGTISSPEFVNKTDQQFVLGELGFHGVGELVPVEPLLQSGHYCRRLSNLSSPVAVPHVILWQVCAQFLPRFK